MCIQHVYISFDHLCVLLNWKLHFYEYLILYCTPWNIYKYHHCPLSRSFDELSWAINIFILAIAFDICNIFLELLQTISHLNYFSFLKFLLLWFPSSSHLSCLNFPWIIILSWNFPFCWNFLFYVTLCYIPKAPSYLPLKKSTLISYLTSHLFWSLSCHPFNRNMILIIIHVIKK